jgi:hypothetical protein
MFQQLEGALILGVCDAGAKMRLTHVHCSHREYIEKPAAPILSEVNHLTIEGGGRARLNLRVRHRNTAAIVNIRFDFERHDASGRASDNALCNRKSSCLLLAAAAAASLLLLLLLLLLVVVYTAGSSRW